MEGEKGLDWVAQNACRGTDPICLIRPGVPCLWLGSVRIYNSTWYIETLQAGTGRTWSGTSLPAARGLVGSGVPVWRSWIMGKRELAREPSGEQGRKKNKKITIMHLQR